MGAQQDAATGVKCNSFGRSGERRACGPLVPNYEGCVHLTNETLIGVRNASSACQ